MAGDAAKKRCMGSVRGPTPRQRACAASAGLTSWRICPQSPESSDPVSRGSHGTEPRSLHPRDSAPAWPRECASPVSSRPRRRWRRCGSCTEGPSSNLNFSLTAPGSDQVTQISAAGRHRLRDHPRLLDYIDGRRRARGLAEVSAVQHPEPHVSRELALFPDWFAAALRIGRSGSSSRVSRGIMPRLHCLWWCSSFSDGSRARSLLRRAPASGTWPFRSKKRSPRCSPTPDPRVRPSGRDRAILAVCDAESPKMGASACCRRRRTIGRAPTATLKRRGLRRFRARAMPAGAGARERRAAPSLPPGPARRTICARGR